METSTKNLMTVKAISSRTGASISFIKKLLAEGRLKRYRINSAVYVSLLEFETIAEPAEA